MQKFDHNIGFGEKRHFFAENCRKSQKIVITTSTPQISPLIWDCFVKYIRIILAKILFTYFILLLF
jgi:hypothetical protein